MTWQDLAVAAIVGWAVVTLYRHLRGMLFVPPVKSGTTTGAGCHGCDDCAEEETAAPRPVEPR